MSNSFLPSTAKPIPKKPFDISEHEWFDNKLEIGGIIDEDSDLFVYLDKESDYGIFINKADAIAIAKALGVTGEDLK